MPMLVETKPVSGDFSFSIRIDSMIRSAMSPAARREVDFLLERLARFDTRAGVALPLA